MAIGAGARVTTRYVAEVTRGTTPGSPAMKFLRATTRDPNLEKDVLESEEVRSTRQVSDQRHGFNRVVGQLGFQLSRADFDEITEIALGGTWAAVTTGSATIAVDGPTQKFTRSGGSFLTDGFRVGHVINSTGFSNGGNNVSGSAVTITVLTATEMTVVGATLVTEGSAAARTITAPGKSLEIGTSLKTVTLERAFEDLTKFQVFRGVAVNNYRLTATPERMINVLMDLIGMSSAAISGTPLDASPDAPVDSSPFAPFDGSILEAGTLIAVVTSLDVTIANNRTVSPVIGSKFTPDIFDGTARVDGTMTALFESETLWNKFFNETESALRVRFNDPNGTDYWNVMLHRVKYNGGAINPPLEGPVVMNMPITALEHATYRQALTIQRSNT